MPEQSFEKHSRLIPGFHFVAFPILLINVFVGAYAGFADGMSMMGAWNVLVAIALVLVAWYSRTMPLTAQDRVIRLEERMRLQQRLPAHLQGRVGEISPRNLIGLRFASDEELPELAERCLNGEFKSSKEIKRSIRTWRPDHLRV